MDRNGYAIALKLGFNDMKLVFMGFHGTWVFFDYPHIYLDLRWRKSQKLGISTENSWNKMGLALNRCGLWNTNNRTDFMVPHVVEPVSEKFWLWRSTDVTPNDLKVPEPWRVNTKEKKGLSYSKRPLNFIISRQRNWFEIWFDTMFWHLEAAIVVAYNDLYIIYIYVT